MVLDNLVSGHRRIVEEVLLILPGGRLGGSQALLNQLLSEEHPAMERTPVQRCCILPTMSMEIRP